MRTVFSEHNRCWSSVTEDTKKEKISRRSPTPGQFTNWCANPLKRFNFSTEYNERWFPCHYWEMFKLIFLHFACSQSKITTPNEDGEYNIRNVFKKSAIRRYLANKLRRSGPERFWYVPVLFKRIKTSSW